jgi:hypothetical protein
VRSSIPATNALGEDLDHEPASRRVQDIDEIRGVKVDGLSRRFDLGHA